MVSPAHDALSGISIVLVTPCNVSSPVAVTSTSWPFTGVLGG
jgi:hypothetical protein